MEGRSMKKSINKLFLNLQYLLFTFFLAGVVIDVIYQVIGENKILDTVLPSLLRYFVKFYLPLALIILLIHCFFLVVKPLQLFVYYHIWIKHIFATLKRFTQSSPTGSFTHSPLVTFRCKVGHWFLDKFFNEFFDTLILNSFCKQKVFFGKLDQNFSSRQEISTSSEEHSPAIQRMSLRKEPVLVHKDHLMEKNYWPNWAFTAILLFNELTLHRYLIEQETSKFRLEVDLHNQCYGIYNTAGKTFLNDAFLNEEFKSRCINESKRIENFLKSRTSQNILKINAREMPFRWASGGMLPIAHLEGRYWYVLYFRDIEPVGLNIANGASETNEEYKNLHTLIYREFSEELVLLDREPDLDDTFPIVQKVFQFPFFSPDSPIINKEFNKKHRQLRREHDNLTIELENGPEIRPIYTPFEVGITNHNVNLQDAVKNVIFNINPTEFGIEVLLVSRFNMRKEDYLMDGEIWEMGPALIRQPVILLSYDYVRKVFEKTGSLGTYVETRPHLNCKDLGRIPAGEYKIFDKDIEFRKRRLEFLEKNNRTSKSKEAKRYRMWFEQYYELFMKVRKSKCDITNVEHSPLTIMCPVTWKSLETICYYNLLDV